MTEAVLDASAVLALIFEEPGADAVEQVVHGAAISAVNLSEVAAVIIHRGVPREEVETLLGGLYLNVIPFETPAAFGAAALRPSTRALGLSLGDRACLDLAKAMNRIAVTADRAWLGLEDMLDIRIQAIR
ncbi:MAG: type II toxin-antitoxin system VapC family toxin [Hyphomonas sp.]